MSSALPNNLEAGIILDDMMAEEDCLQLSAYFSGLDSEELDSFREHMFKKSVARGEVTGHDHIHRYLRRGEGV